MAEDAPRHPLIELTLGRLREFGREPSAIFWTPDRAAWTIWSWVRLRLLM